MPDPRSQAPDGGSNLREGRLKLRGGEGEVQLKTREGRWGGVRRRRGQWKRNGNGTEMERKWNGPNGMEM